MWYIYNGTWYNSDALDNYGEVNFSNLNPVLQATIIQTVSRYGLTVAQLTSISYVIRFSGKQHKILLHYDNGKEEFEVLTEIPVKILRRFYHAFKDKYIYPIH